MFQHSSTFHFQLLVTSIIMIVTLCYNIPIVRSDSIDDNAIRLPGSQITTNNNKYDTVCGAEDKYWNPPAANSCPVKCFRPDPVCGVDGVTYWCGCEDARCSGTKVAEKGFCEAGIDGAATQALLLVHIVWLIFLGFSILFGLF